MVIWPCLGRGCVVANDLDVYGGGGGLAPYNPGQSLAPAPDFGTGEAPQGLDTFSRQYTGGGQVVFGQTLPSGVTIEKMTEAFVQLGSVFVSDFLKLGHNISQSQKAAQWLINAVANPPQPTAKRHSYNLYEHTNDPTFQAFANYAHDNKFPAKFVQDACWWVSEAARRLNAQQTNSQPEGSRTAQGSAPNSSEKLLGQLSDSDYAKVVAINIKAQLDTLNTLAVIHGQYTAQQMVVLANAHLEKLTPAERAHFDQFTTVNGVDWIHILNCADTIEFLYSASIGSASLPQDGASIAKEIAQFEAMLKIPSERAKYMKDSAMQARLRELYARRG